MLRLLTSLAFGKLLSQLVLQRNKFLHDVWNSNVEVGGELIIKDLEKKKNKKKSKNYTRQISENVHKVLKRRINNTTAPNDKKTTF